MKTPEEWALILGGATIDERYFHEEAMRVAEMIQKEAYNQAIEDVCQVLIDARDGVTAMWLMDLRKPEPENTNVQ